MKRSIFIGILLFIFALGFGLTAGYFAGNSLQTAISKYKQNNNDQDPQEEPLPINRQNIVSFAEIVKKARPAVVNIFSEKKVLRQMPFFLDPFDINSLFLKEQIQRGLGSGVMISPDGYIVTNNHVIQGADKIKVSLSTGQEKAAKLIGSDPHTDLALLKIDSEIKAYDYMNFGDSEHLEVGDIVLAIGNPFGIGQTVTMGIISALKRENIGLVDYEDFIQTDAAINPGNSGGALIDAQGNLIGINTGIYSQSGTYQGIGFAVPSTFAKEIIQQLKESGKAERINLGVYITDLDEYNNHPYIQAFWQAKYRNGALVLKTNPTGLGHNLAEGTLITKLNGQEVKDSYHLIKLLFRLKLTDKVELETVNLDLKTKKIKTDKVIIKAGK